MQPRHLLANVARRLSAGTPASRSRAALIADTQQLERRVGKLEVAGREQADQLQRLEMLSEDLVAAVEALRQRVERHG